MIHLHKAVENCDEAGVLALLEQAEGFDFGPLVLENRPELGIPGGAFIVPRFSSVESELVSTGLLQLPSPVCWYEFGLGATTAAVLVFETDETISVLRFDALNGWKTAACIAALRRKDVRPDGGFSLAYYSKPGEAVLLSADGPEVQVLYGSAVTLALYLTLMLISKTTETEHVNPRFTNKLRAKKGKVPLKAHTVVRIVPYKYISESQREAGRSHASPRLHWRRSHIRVYQKRTPGSVFIEGKGWCVPIARMLVGSADRGEVSHEYFIQNPRKTGLQPPG